SCEEGSPGFIALSGAQDPAGGVHASRLPSSSRRGGTRQSRGRGVFCSSSRRERAGSRIEAPLLVEEGRDATGSRTGCFLLLIEERTRRVAHRGSPPRRGGAGRDKGRGRGGLPAPTTSRGAMQRCARSGAALATFGPTHLGLRNDDSAFRANRGDLPAGDRAQPGRG